MTTVDHRRSNRINDLRRILSEREPTAGEARIEALYMATDGPTLHDKQWSMLLNLLQAEPEGVKLSATKALGLAAKAKALVKVQRVDPVRADRQYNAALNHRDEEYAHIRMAIVRSIMRDNLPPAAVADMLEALVEKYPEHRGALTKECHEYRMHVGWRGASDADAHRRANGGDGATRPQDW